MRHAVNVVLSGTPELEAFLDVVIFEINDLIKGTYDSKNKSSFSIKFCCVER